MALEPNAPKEAAKKSALDAPTRADDDGPLAAKKKPADCTVEVDGKIVRTDAPPIDRATQAFNEETVVTVPREEPPVDSNPESSVGSTGSSKSPTILGGFKLIKKIGQGGMGAVYKAQQVSDSRIVAIKVLPKKLCGNDSFVQRFKREARVMKELDHPNILTCIEHGEAQGIYFIAIEYVEGGSVEGWLKKLGRFSVGDALHIILKTAYGLKHAHDKNMIHRDIKPDNILLTKEGVVKVADLGLAKDTEEDVNLTKTGTGAGTPVYMAPEQARDVKHVDCRVDIYALGVMLYVFLTGQPPFAGNTLVDLISAKEKGKFEPIRKHNDEIPPKLNLIVDKMIAKDPKLRYSSCDEVIAALELLGLANDELSFLGGAEGTAQEETPASSSKKAGKPAATKTPAAPDQTEPAAVARKAKTSVGAAGKPAKTNIEEDAEEEVHGVWYWRLVTQEGKAITKKVTTDQIRNLIKAGHLDQTAQISKKEHSGFRTAATFTEFQGAFKSLETATKANTQGKTYRDQYKEIEAADARRRRWGWLTRLTKSFGGTLLGLLWIALILVLVGTAAYLAWTYLKPV